MMDTMKEIKECLIMQLKQWETNVVVNGVKSLKMYPMFWSGILEVTHQILFPHFLCVVHITLYRMHNPLRATACTFLVNRWPLYYLYIGLKKQS